jgi:hypothetical protein
MKEGMILLYRLRNYEVVTQTIHDGKTDYSANIFNVGIPVSDKNNHKLWEEFDNKADEYMELWKEQLSKNIEYSYDTYFSGATSLIVPYGVSPKDIYWNCYANKHSKSWIKNYFKYKKCKKEHKDSLIYFTEHVEDNFCTSVMTEKELEDTRKGRDELVALCHVNNCTFIMSEINKGFWYALKRDIERIANKI